MSLLTTRRLTKVYDHVPVVDRIDLEFVEGRVTALLGRNGAGKTTTFLMMAGIVKPDGGEVLFNGRVINDLPSHQRARQGLVYLPQQHSVFIHATALGNLIMILEFHHDEPTARRKAQELLADFGLAHLQDSPAYALSGGEKRRLEIARASIMAPRFLFLDEPFTGIDPITIIDLQKVITKIRERGIGVIITDHNVKDTFFITDLAYIIHKGRILCHGKPAELVCDDQARQLFLGDEFDSY
jgi:lipopolysaccharide export system ATP-binding protein